MKQKTIKIKLAVLLLIGIFFLNTQIQAQVTIGSGIAPDDNALLDLKEGELSNLLLKDCYYLVSS